MFRENREKSFVKNPDYKTSNVTKGKKQNVKLQNVESYKTSKVTKGRITKRRKLQNLEKVRKLQKAEKVRKLQKAEKGRKIRYSMGKIRGKISSLRTCRFSTHSAPFSLF
jgi:hypothetical protein